MNKDLTKEDLQSLNSVELAEKLHSKFYKGDNTGECFLFIDNRRKFTFLISEFFVYLRDFKNFSPTLELLKSLIDLNMFVIQIEGEKAIETKYGKQYLPFLIEKRYIEYGKHLPLQRDFEIFVIFHLNHKNPNNQTEQELKNNKNQAVLFFIAAKEGLEKYLNSLNIKEFE